MVPAANDLTALAAALAALDSNSTISVKSNGRMQITFQGTIWSATPAWIATPSMQPSGFSGVGGNVAFAGNGLQQVLYPTFATFSKLSDTLKSLDAKSNVTLQIDGTVSAVLKGANYTFVPDYSIVATPASHINDTYWVVGSRIFLNEGNGSSQSFTLQ